MENTMEEEINNPKHYTVGGLDTISIMEAKLTKSELNGFLRGNVLKYITRGGHKDDTLKDYKKAQWYLDRLVCRLEKKD